MSAASINNTMRWCGWILLLRLIATCDAGCHLFPGSSKYTTSVKINIAGNPHSYVPGTAYPVTLSSETTFKRFYVTLDGENGGGSFQISDARISFSEDCSNTLVEMSPKSPMHAVQFLWNAPSSGCTSISASVNVNGNWKSNNISLCPLRDDKMMKKIQEPSKCCACDHAKYKIVFEGLWSNETHPKDFPVNSQFTHFSDIIGTTHAPTFSMWEEGAYSSYGFQQLAEYGVVKELETELKNSSYHLRSIVRATGLWWPRVNSNTTAQFLVDPRHYLFSFASMFGPSPDWVVGLSSLNLCLDDCTWSENEVIDLYPYDAGTDDGISYQSIKVPTVPHDRIRKITTTYPEDPRSPFYDPSKDDFSPVARIYITRSKVIPKKCSDLSEKEILEQVTVSENTEDEGRVGCEVGTYSEWTQCTVTCGKGIRMRQRSYLNPKIAKDLNCDRQLISREMCVAADKCEGDDDLEENIKPMAPGECDVTAWSDWSDCTVSCGIGMKIRQRTFLSSDDRVTKKCGAFISTMEKEKCMMPTCSGGRLFKLPTSCATTEWSDWSTCSATCGSGVITRIRTFKETNPPQVCKEEVPLAEKVKCSGSIKCTFSGSVAKRVCLSPLAEGPCRGNFARYGYDSTLKRCIKFTYGGCRGNKNNFETLDECEQTCGKGDYTETGTSSKKTEQVRNCVVSQWSDWSPCNPCTKGTRTRTRVVLKEPLNGGRTCPSLKKTAQCSMSEEFCRAMSYT